MRNSTAEGLLVSDVRVSPILQACLLVGGRNNAFSTSYATRLALVETQRMRVQEVHFFDEAFLKACGAWLTAHIGAPYKSGAQSGPM